METASSLMAAQEIRELKARYFECMDGKDWAGFRSVFAEDAIFDMRDGRGQNADPDAVFTGADNIVAFVRQAIDPLRTLHCGQAKRIDVLSPTSAQGLWLMEDRLEVPDGAACPFRRMHGWGHYHETYECIGGQWRIKTLKLSRLWVHVES